MPRKRNFPTKKTTGHLTEVSMQMHGDYTPRSKQLIKKGMMGANADYDVNPRGRQLSQSVSKRLGMHYDEATAKKLWSARNWRKYL